jgi:cytochrome oxidase Cu insertion factor (SCO1/SenC/PrrC family)
VKLRTLRWILTVAAAAMAVVVIVVSVIAATRHSGAGRTASVPAPLAAGTALSRPRALPELRLIDAAGRTVSPQSWRGRWVILAPSMTLCHEVCPMTTAVLNQVQAAVQRAGLDRRVVVATATVDP